MVTVSPLLLTLSPSLPPERRAGHQRPLCRQLEPVYVVAGTICPVVDKASATHLLQDD